MPSITVEINKKRSLNGRKIIGYTARLPNGYSTVREEGKTPKEARDALLDRLNEVTCQDHDNFRIVSFFGHVVVLWQRLHGGERVIVYPDGRQSIMLFKDREKNAFDREEISARYHVAQSLNNVGPLVTAKLNTDAEQKEFANWQQWQERYKAARKAGYDDRHCHSYACGGLGLAKQELDAMGAKIASTEQTLQSGHDMELPQTAELLDHASASDPQILIVCQGGLVQEVVGLPEGAYEICDMDTFAEDSECEQREYFDSKSGTMKQHLRTSQWSVELPPILLAPSEHDLNSRRGDGSHQGT